MVKKMLIPGDWVLYGVKNEIGLVRTTSSRRHVFVWTHKGGVSAQTPLELVRRIDRPDMFHEYDNRYALPSLEERRIRLLSGKGPTNDLIDDGDVRPAIRRKYGE